MSELRRRRRALGWSVPRLSEESGISAGTIWNIEQGKHSPAVSTLEKLARALGCRVVDLFPEAPHRDAIVRQVLEAVHDGEMGVPEAVDTLESLGVLARKARDGRHSASAEAVAG